jgi:hypothetical protein
MAAERRLLHDDEGGLLEVAHDVVCSDGRGHRNSVIITTCALSFFESFIVLLWMSRCREESGWRTQTGLCFLTLIKPEG